MFARRRATVPLVLLAALAGVAASPELHAADPPPAAQVTASQIDQAVHQLGDHDYRIRERATRTLWEAGEAAVPALRRASEAGDPEVGRRARAILSNITLGLTPDMSGEILALMGRYRTGDAGVKRQAAVTLAQLGSPGARVLLKLREEERDPAIRAVVASILLRQSRELAVSLIGDGDEDTAGRLLAVAADTGDERAAMNHAAFLLVRGGLDEAIAATQQRLADAETRARDANVPAEREAAAEQVHPVATRLAFLCRAAGDLPAARAAAERAGEGGELLVWNLLVETGDWAELARRAAVGDDNRAAPGVADLSFAAAFHRLAGDEAGVDRFAQLLRAEADRDPDRSWNPAEGLLLNGRVDLGVDVLVRHGHLAEAVDFQAQRLKFEDVPRLLERARALRSNDLGEVEVKAARATWFTGGVDAAAVALEEAVTGCVKRRDIRGLVEGVGAAVDMGLDERVRWYTIAAMQEAQRGQPANAAPGNVAAGMPMAELFTRARFREPARAAAWWQVLRQRFPREPAAKTLDTLRAIDQRKIGGDELQALVDLSRQHAIRRPPELRDVQLELFADTLADAGRRAQATAGYAELSALAAETSPARAAGALSKLAAFDAEAGNFREAADRYLQAWQVARNDPVPLYLSGWALSQAGDTSIGGRRMARAHLLPLSDQNARFELYEALLAKKLTAEAGREHAAILRTAEFLSWRRSEALRRAGDEAHAAGDAARAADLWERAFLDNNSEQTKFVEPWANVSMPALVRRTRAVGLLRAGDVAAGVREAEASLAMSPGDVDCLIDAVTVLDETAHRDEADALYRRAIEPYRKLCDAHPNSGPLHNLYAWAAAKCRRELDAALRHAKRAVELQPANTASLDTLAEAHFHRQEFDDAIRVMQRCAELEPEEPRHKEQLERFRKGKAGASQPGAMGTTRPSAAR